MYWKEWCLHRSGNVALFVRSDGTIATGLIMTVWVNRKGRAKKPATMKCAPEEIYGFRVVELTAVKECDPIQIIPNISSGYTNGYTWGWKKITFWIPPRLQTLYYFTEHNLNFDKIWSANVMSLFKFPLLPTCSKYVHLTSAYITLPACVLRVLRLSVRTSVVSTLAVKQAPAGSCRWNLCSRCLIARRVLWQQQRIFKM